MGSWENYARLVGQQNNDINPKFPGRHIQLKNDHQVKETCAITSTQVTCVTHHISVLVIQQCQVHYIFVFYVFHCNLKE